MTKRILKGVGAAGLVAALAILSVPAEAGQIACTIPFSFTVGGKTLAPGTYTISTEQSVLWVRGVANGAVVLTNRLESREGTEAKVVFHRYGTQYFLRQAWMGGVNGRELPEPRRESELAKAGRSGKVATSFERVVLPVM